MAAHDSNALTGEPQGRAVGLDYGTKRVGLAVADPLRLFARPLDAVPPADVVARLRAIDAADRLDVLVVGWPLTLAGEEGEATERVQQFIDRLEEAFPGVAVVRRDERFTSEMAKDAIREFGQRRSGEPLLEKGRVDAAAAALILQDWLDADGKG